MVTIGNEGVAMALLRIAKMLLWAKLVAKVFVAIIFCFQASLSLDNKNLNNGCSN